MPENVRKRLKERNLSKDKLNRISSPKLHRSTNKRFYFTPTESQTGVRLAGEALKSLPNVTPWTKGQRGHGCKRFQKPVTW
jgi:hypothetical protein